MKKILNTKVFLLLIAAAVLPALLPFNAQASKKELLAIAEDTPVAGWNLLKDSTIYGSGIGLADIYDGGYEVYTNAGVVDALRRMYVKGEEYVEATVHYMKSPSAARAFLEERYKMETGKKAPAKAEWNRFTASGAGGATEYAIEGFYFIIVMSYHGGDEGKEQAAPFMKSLLENAVKFHQGKKR